MLKPKRIFSLISLSLFCSLQLFGQKANTNNSHLEFDNLKTDKTYKTVSGKVSQDSRVVRYVYNENFGPLVGTAEQKAKQYLEKNAMRFGIEDVESQLKVANSVTSPGGQHVTYNQYLNEIPVFRSEIVVTINNENSVTFVTSNFRPNLNVKSFSTSVSIEKALSIAKNYLNVTGKMLGEAKAELMIFDSKDKGAQLAYRTEIPTEKPMGDWQVFVNAESGEIIHVKDRMMYQNKATGSGMAFDPDPLTSAGVYYGGDYVDNGDLDNDSLNNQRMNIILQGLTYSNGLYSLEGPYCVLDDRESPSDNFPELADSTGFNYTRFQKEFEDVNVYFHIDLSYRWLMSMGYDIPGLYQFSSDPHGLNGDDNSHFVPSQNYCAWGEGGVDDSEDAAVIWHEYGHAIQDNIPPSMSYSGETMSLQEGSSDYWAASYSRSLYDFGWGIVFFWDAGHTDATSSGTIWPGRHCDLDWVYPNDYVSGHNGGQIWSSALMKMWPILGRTVTDNLFIESHYIWGSSPGLEDAAAAFIQADRNLYGGAHLTTIVEWFDFHGLVDATQFIPQVTHTPLSDTEDIVGPYTVEAEIFPATAPLDTANLFVYWGLNGAFTDSVLLQSTGVTDQYSADIPGTGIAASVNYYITVIDTANNLVYHPANAPVEYHSFYAGSDTISPIIFHSPLRDQVYMNWPATVSAYVTDNLGIADATVNYYINDVGTTGSFQMTDQGSDNYIGTFDFDTTSISVGDSIFYSITATDSSSNANYATDPTIGFHKFTIIDTKGFVLIINDDVTKTAKIEDSKGTYFRTEGTLGASSNNMERWLVNLGYIVDHETVSASLSINWDSYSIVINSSGGNESPITNTNYRNKWETYASDPAHKYLIEGGEVGYDAASFPGYPAFAANVIHTDDWNIDDAGPMNLIESYSTHPLVTIPNSLPVALSVDYQGWGDQDAQNALAPAYVIYETTDYPNYAGITIFDDNINPVSAQMVYYAFNFAALIDTVAAQQLLENTLEYLLTPETIIEPPQAPANLAILDSNLVISLSWDAVPKANFKADYYNIYKSLNGSAFSIADSTADITYTDSLVTAGNMYYYYVTATANGLKSIPSDTVFATVEDPTGIDEKWGQGIPSVFDIDQNYPNPFNPATTIRYQLPKATNVYIAVYDMLGQKIRTLVDENQTSNYYTIQWDGLNESGGKVASGVYLYRIEADTFIKTNKMLLLK